MENRIEVSNENSSENLLPIESAEKKIIEMVGEPVYQSYLTEINKLPQAPFLLTSNINNWLLAMQINDPTRMFWHIKRLNGFGGSEIGHLVADTFDEFDFFGSARETVASKLMLSIPEGPNGDTARGTYMESYIQERFRSQFKATGLDDVMKRMGDFRSEKHPWLVGNTDDYVQIGKKRFLVDYKCPRPGFEEKYNKSGVKFDYIAQLHLYALILKEMGERVDGLLLCSFDMVKWDIDVRPVSINQKMYDAILEQGDNMWFSYVLTGELPPFPNYEAKINVLESNLKEESRLRISELTKELSIIMPIANNAYAKAAKMKEEIVELLNEAYIGHPKLASGLINIGVKEEFDPEKILEVAEANLIDLKKYETVPVPNLEAAWDYLSKLQEKQGLDMSEFTDYTVDFTKLGNDLMNELGQPKHRLMSETYRIEMTKSKAQNVLDVINHIKEVAEETVQNHISQVNEIELEPIRYVEDKEKKSKKVAM